MGILDQFFIYHPEPWQDRDWAKLSGLPLEDIWFQAADGARLFGWYVEAQANRPVILFAAHGMDLVPLAYRSVWFGGREKSERRERPANQIEGF